MWQGANDDKIIDVIVKGLDVQQTIMTVMFGAVAYVLAREWPDQAHPMSRRAKWKIFWMSLFPSLSLGVIILGHSILLKMVSRGETLPFAQSWAFPGYDLLLNFLILCSLVAIAFGLFR